MEWLKSEGAILDNESYMVEFEPYKNKHGTIGEDSGACSLQHQLSVCMATVLLLQSCDR